jgi:hypothetical protein
VPRRRCPSCKAFLKARKRRCGRCDQRTRQKTRLARRAERALLRLQTTSRAEGWRLPKLHKAMAVHRRRIGLDPVSWKELVKLIFGATPDGIVDPRQMSLF